MYKPKAYFGTDLNKELNKAIKAFFVYLDLDNGGDQLGVQGCSVDRARCFVIGFSFPSLLTFSRGKSDGGGDGAGGFGRSNGLDNQARR